MERPSPVIFSIATILLSKASKGYEKYGKYVKWSACGILTVFGVSLVLDRFIGDKKKITPPADPPEADPAPGPVLQLLRRPIIFHGIDGPVVFPNIGDRDSVDNYIAIHRDLSRSYLEERNFYLAAYHCSLMTFVHPDPMAYFEANSGDMSESTYEISRRSLISVLQQVENQMRREDRQALVA